MRCWASPAPPSVRVRFRSQGAGLLCFPVRFSDPKELGVVFSTAMSKTMAAGPNYMTGRFGNEVQFSDRKALDLDKAHATFTFILTPT